MVTQQNKNNRKQEIWMLKVRRFFVIFLLSSISLVFYSTPSLSHAYEFAVISSPGTPALSESDIRAIYLGVVREIDGIMIRAYLPKDEKILKEFLDFLGVSETEFKTTWFMKALSGEGVIPRKLSTEEIIRRAKRMKGVIGIVPKDKIPEGVSVILK